MLLLGLAEQLPKLNGSSDFYTHAKYWIFPLQTVLCGALVFAFRHQYELSRPRGVVFAVAIGALSLAVWIAPQEALGFPPRLDGFDPGFFAPGWPYSLSLLFRFLRLVVVVPFLEEIFWRGFLLRYVIREDFENVPFGTFNWASFGIVTLCFGLAHWGPDFVPALIVGALFNLVAIRTRSLSVCVLTHAVTNLLLGGYIMATRQWGFW